MQMWAYASRKRPYFHAALLTAAVVVTLAAIVSVMIATSPASKVTLIVLLAIITAAVVARRAWNVCYSGPAHDSNRQPLAARVKAQTDHASASSDLAPTHPWASLELLQTVLAEFVDNPHSPRPFLRLLRQIEGLTHATCSAIFVTGNIDEPWSPLTCTDNAQCERFTHLLRDEAFMADVRARGVVQRRNSAHGDAQLVILRLHHGETNGESFLLLQIPRRPALSAAEIGSLKTLGMYLAGIIRSARRAQQNQRLALCDERAVIARELHDSLAQSLSYLKIQASRLQSLLHMDAPERALDYKDTDAVLQELRAHLNLAYRQLRELITTFRLTMDGRSLAQALADSVEEFESRSSIVFSLDNRIAAGLLSVDEEMQVLQIVRECICNIVRHAHARCATVALRSDGAGSIAITVDDDGIGLGAPIASEQHHGLVIMQQRAHSLGGEMHVSANPDGGTRVQVIFTARGAGSGRKPQPTPLERTRPFADKVQS